MREAQCYLMLAMLALLGTAFGLTNLNAPWSGFLGELFPETNILFVLVVMLALSGFVSGLTGFGFSAVGIVTLWVLPPTTAIPLLMMLSLANQIYSYWLLQGAAQEQARQATEEHNGQSSPSLPFIAGGLIGVPAGIWLLACLPAKSMTLSIGAVLVAYSTWAWFKPQLKTKPMSGGLGKLLTGATGGVIGGFTAFPGSALVVWSSLQGLNKAEQRKVVQPFIIAMQVLSLLIMALSTNLLDLQKVLLFACLCPVVLPSTALGVTAFKRFSDKRFQQLVIVMLAVSGLSMVLKASI